MPEQHLLPIALPRGRSGNTGYLTVYFSPRLKEPGVLHDYMEWMRWPDTLASLTIRIGLSDGAATSWVVPTPVGVSADPKKWQNTFRQLTPVDPYRFVDWSKAPLQTVATSDFSEAVLELYAGVAGASPNHPPSGGDLLGAPQASVLSGAPLGEVVSYVQPMEGERLEAAREPDWDFHEYVSLLGAHPEVLRHLGLAVDVEIQFPAGVGKPTSVTVRTDYEAQYGANGAREAGCRRGSWMPSWPNRIPPPATTSRPTGSWSSGSRVPTCPFWTRSPRQGGCMDWSSA